MSSGVTISHPVIITLGDPNGLGPELVVRYFSQNGKNTHHTISAPIRIIGPEVSLTYHTQRCEVEPFWEKIASPCGGDQQEPEIALCEPEGLDSFVMNPGKAEVAGGEAAGKSLDLACSLLKGDYYSSLVTCPLNKAMLNKAGFPFRGHTEFLAKRAGLDADDVCMHLGGPKLRVSLVTTHPAYVDVPGQVTQEKILRCIRLTCIHLQQLNIKGSLAVCGLNPHAGEEGTIGTEERDTILPAIVQAQKQGFNVVGPVSGDTVCTLAYQGKYGAVLAMYHDQGLGPLKLAHFNEAANITLGLPYHRVSVDHGTGYDLVGTGRASLGSFMYAMHMVQQLNNTSIG